MDLSVITISHGHDAEVKRLYKSILNKKWKVEYELLLIDNLPPHKTASIVRKNFPGVKILKNKRPRGFAHNVNIGIKNSGGRYIFLLNPDIIVGDHLFDRMVEFMDKHPDVGVSAPVLLNLDGSRQPSARRFPNFLIIMLRGLGIDRYPTFKALNQKYLGHDVSLNNGYMNVDWVTGAAMLVRRKAYEVIGPFDDKNFFLYFEDVDYCYRLWKAGWHVAYVTNATAIHEWKRYSKNPFSIYKFYHIVSGLRFFKKYGLKLKNPREGLK